MIEQKQWCDKIYKQQWWWNKLKLIITERDTRENGDQSGRLNTQYFCWKPYLYPLMFIIKIKYNWEKKNQSNQT